MRNWGYNPYTESYNSTYQLVGARFVCLRSWTDQPQVNMRNLLQIRDYKSIETPAFWGPRIDWVDIPFVGEQNVCTKCIYLGWTTNTNKDQKENQTKTKKCPPPSLLKSAAQTLIGNP